MKTATTSTVWHHCFDSLKGASSFILYVFFIVRANVNRINKKLHFKIIQKLVSSLWILKENWGSPELPMLNFGNC